MLFSKKVAQTAVRHSSTLAKAQGSLAKVTDRAAAAAQKGKNNAIKVYETYKGPVINTALVTKELAKEIYVKEKLNPPSLAEFGSTYTVFYNNAKSFAFWQKVFQSGDWLKLGIYAIEAYGIFKIGEIIGRRHLVGYKLDEESWKKDLPPFEL